LADKKSAGVKFLAPPMRCVYLPSNNSFQRNSSAGLKQGFLLQKIIETRSNVFL